MAKECTPPLGCGSVPSMIAAAPWDLAMHLPWSPLTSPLDKWAAQPSFLLGEYLFYACTVMAFLHARKHGRSHLLVWFAALLAGTANDMLFMALPMVDNFWQAQATIMLTPRLPLYIPCVYICFMYFPTVAVWRLGLPKLAQAALTGLLAELFYAPYDIVGAKFLWWTWHDTDLPIANRLMGAPVGSSMWVITFVGAFALLLSLGMRKDPEVRERRTILASIGLAIGLSSALMVVQVQSLQPLDGGIPGPRGLITVIALYGGVVLWGFGRREAPFARAARDRLLQVAAVLYFSSLLLVAATVDPATHRNASVHQTYGPCHVEAKDIMGFTRYEFLCAEDYDEPFDFSCVEHLPVRDSQWYTVCGKPHEDYGRFMLVLAMLCGLGIAAYGTLLSDRLPSRPG